MQRVIRSEDRASVPLSRRLRRQVGRTIGIALCAFLMACAAPGNGAPSTATRSPSPTSTSLAVSTEVSPGTAIPTATDTAIPSPTRLPTGTPTPSRTATRPPSPLPLLTATSTAHPSATPSRVTTSIVGSSPTPAPASAQECGALAARGTSGIFIVYIHPEPDLVWDDVPHRFRVGLCNTLPPPSVPQGRYKVVLSFPGGNRGSASSSEVRAELHPGLNEVSIGPWVPGLENHLAICATRAVGQTQVMYNDSPEPVFHPLPWVDGKVEVGLPIRCGGDYS